MVEIELQKTTLQKGLERILPELNSNEKEELFHNLGVWVKKKNGRFINSNHFYSQLSIFLSRELSITPDKCYEDLGKYIYNQLQSRVKRYDVQLNVNNEQLTIYRRREIAVLTDIVGKLKKEI